MGRISTPQGKEGKILSEITKNFLTLKDLEKINQPESKPAGVKTPPLLG